MSKFGTKNVLFGYFWATILNNYCHIWNQHLRISVIAKFCEETKLPKYGIKNALFGYFWQKCLIWVFLGKIFRKAIVIFKISTLKFVKLRNFTKKQKYINLGPKMPDLGIFGLEFENNIVIFEISILEFAYLQNFVKKQKCLNLGSKMRWVFLTKNTVFGYFGARIF